MTILTRMLVYAGRVSGKVLRAHPLLRREALERLWDAWERLKSLADPGDKKRSIKVILDAAAAEPSLRARLEEEAKELTGIGNSHLIRHSEVCSGARHRR